MLPGDFSVFERKNFRIHFSKNERLQDVFCISSFFLVALIARIPWFSRLDTNWDEHSFILIAQGILNGHLPYETLMDIKPPLVFFVTALPLLFGKHIEYVRFMGVLEIFFISLLIYGIARFYVDRVFSFIAAQLFPVVSLYYDGNFLSAEIIALSFLLAGVYLALKYSLKRNVFWVGFCFSLACLVRMNLAYFVIIISCYLLFYDFSFTKKTLYRFFAYAAGGIAPVLVFIILYAVSGSLDRLILCSVIAPLEYSHAGSCYLKNVISTWQTVYARIVGTPYVSYPFLLALGAGCLGYVGLLPQAWRRVRNREFSPAVFLLFSVAGAVIASLMTGQSYLHYSLQYLPLLCVLVAFTGKLRVLSWRPLQAGLLIAVVLFTFGLGAGQFFANSLKKADYVREIGTYLNTHCSPENDVLFLEAHIFNWWMDKPLLLRPMAHPSNMHDMVAVRDTFVRHGYMRKGLLEAVLDASPAFIVVKDPVPASLQTLFKQKVFPYYSRAYCSGPLAVYRLNPKSSVQKPLSGANNSAHLQKTCG